MTVLTKRRPEPSEYPPFYQGYISLVEGADILAALDDNTEKGLAIYRSISESEALQRYAPEKWTIKEVLGHITDTERVFSYRGLRVARGDQTPLPGFDENLFVKGANFNDFDWPALIEQFELVRKSSIALFKSLAEEAWDRRGNANGKEVSVRAIAWMVAGHELHHRRIVLERYLHR